MTPPPEPDDEGYRPRLIRSYTLTAGRTATKVELEDRRDFGRRTLEFRGVLLGHRDVPADQAGRAAAGLQEDGVDGGEPADGA